MSEYTNYFAVKATSEKEVQVKLDAAKVRSVVDADKDDYWVNPIYQRKGAYQWVTVSAPANSGFENSNFFYENQFEKISTVFQTLIHYFQAEDMESWSIKVKHKYVVVEKLFSLGNHPIFTEDEKLLFSQCFDKDFFVLNKFLQASKGAEFLNFVGIPYMEMNDQDQIEIHTFNDRYSLLANEL